MKEEGSAGVQSMIDMPLLLWMTAVLYLVATGVVVHRYYVTKYKPNLPFAGTALFLSFAAIFGALISVAGSSNLSLAKFFYRCSTTSGVFAFVFLNMFAIAMTKPSEKMRGIWIALSSFLILAFIVWGFDPSKAGVIGGALEFTLMSTYKAPYGPPLVETALALMAVMAFYPAYLFFSVAKNTKYTIIKVKSSLICISIIFGSAAYAIEITDAISYQYMPIYRPMILVWSSIIFFSYLMPRQTELIFVGHAPASPEMVKSFVEEFFTSPIAPNIQTQPQAFSKTLGLTHQQMVGRKILFEFDPTSNYEKAIQDLVAEASAKIEPTIVFTRWGSAIHSSLREQKAVKFFCLTQRVSVPTEFSENEMLLPSKDTSLMLDVFDKTLKAHPEGNINMVFDSLSDLVMSIGFEKTYRFMRYAIEMLTSRNTVLFLLNQTAHDSKIEASLRSLFSEQISFGKEGIQTVKLSKVEVGKVET